MKAAFLLLAIVGWSTGCRDGTSYQDIQVLTATAAPDRGLVLDVASCNASDVSVSTVELADSVRVHAMELDGSSTDDCGYTELVHLRRPLGGRAVIDETTNKSVPPR